MSDNAMKRLYQTLKPNTAKLISELGSTITFGTVLSVAPLKVFVENRLELDQDFLVVSNFCREIFAWDAIMHTEGQLHSHYTPDGLVTTVSNGHYHDIPRQAIGEMSPSESHTHFGNEIYTTSILGHRHKLDSFETGTYIRAKGLDHSVDTCTKGYGSLVADAWNFWHHHELSGNVATNESSSVNFEIPEHTHQVALNGATILTLVKSKLWRGLRVGDKVNMIMQSDKQKFYIIERQEMEID